MLANRGDVLSGTLFAHMWTGPDVYFWGSCLDVIPLGEGHIVTCTLKLLDNESQIARNLLANLVDFAASLIRPGNEERSPSGWRPNSVARMYSGSSVMPDHQPHRWL